MALEPSKTNVFETLRNLLKTSRLAQSAVTVTSLYILREFGYYFYRKYYHLPPGPNGYPIVGCLPNVIFDRLWHIKMAKKYGAIFLCPIISTPILFINDPSIVKQLTIQKHQLSRDQSWKPLLKYTKHKSILSVGDDNTMPLIYINGDKWTKRRKHAQTTLFRAMTNDYVGGVLLNSIENELVPYLDNLIKQNTSWIPTELCQYLAFNTIYHTMFGHSIERKSKLYNEMITDFDNTFKFMTKNAMLMSFRWAKYIKSWADPVRFTRQRRNENMRNLIKQRIEENTQNIKQTYIDYTHKLVIDGEMTSNEEIADAYFLFIAGIDTTSSTLEFGIVLIAKNINIQTKVRKELLSIMNDGIFNLKLVHNCPLFRACIYDILRITSVVYIGVSRTSYKDEWIDINGNKYKIPKGTAIQPNIDYIHSYNKSKDPKWRDINGDKICLENFLSDDGKRFVMNESFIGFGVGRRDCVGRQVAMKELQYILGYLIMHYNLSLDNNNVNVINHKKPIPFATLHMSPNVGVRIQPN